MRRPSLSALLTWALIAASLGLGACSQFHYYDVDITLDGPTFTGSTVSQIQVCHVFVTGAETSDQTFTKNCPPPNNAHHVGIFEYSSLADSGSLTFTVKVSDGLPEEQCQVGQGAVTLPVGATTVNGMLTVVRTTTASSVCSQQ